MSKKCMDCGAPDHDACIISTVEYSPPNWRCETCGTCAWLGDSVVGLRKRETEEIVGKAGYCRRGPFGYIGVENLVGLDVRLGLVNLKTRACPAWEKGV
jgi:hypothetical protein